MPDSRRRSAGLRGAVAGRPLDVAVQTTRRADGIRRVLRAAGRDARGHVPDRAADVGVERRRGRRRGRGRPLDAAGRASAHPSSHEAGKRARFDVAAPRSYRWTGGGRSHSGRGRAVSPRYPRPRAALSLVQQVDAPVAGRPHAATGAAVPRRRRARPGRPPPVRPRPRCGRPPARFASPRRRRSLASCTCSGVGPRLSGPGVSRTHGRPSKRGSERNTAQPSRAELALAEVGVAVAVGAERRLRVVEVQRAEPVEADDRVAVVEHRRRAPRRCGCRSREASRWQESRQTPSRASPPRGLEQRARAPRTSARACRPAPAVFSRCSGQLSLSASASRITSPARSIAGADVAGLRRARDAGRRRAAPSASPACSDGDQRRRATSRGSRRSSLAQLSR